MSEDGRAAAYGGPGWSARETTLRAELGEVWADCGVASEWAPLETVLMHRPAGELQVEDAGAALMLARVDPERAGQEHDAIVAAYRSAGVVAHALVRQDLQRAADREIAGTASRLPPNLMFVADLAFMTPEGAILARPASTVRAGEERIVAARLAALGIPILRSLRGTAVFEASDAMWLDSRTVLLATGLRTNKDGADQVAGMLRELGVSVVRTNLPPGTMHLMGQVRFLDRDLAVVRRGRLDDAAIAALRTGGYRLVEFPDDREMDHAFAHNFVTLGPRDILMPAGCTVTETFYASLGVHCRTVPIATLTRAAGGIGCLTCVLKRST